METSNAISVYFPFEELIPVFPFTEIFYAGTYIFVLLIPFIIKTKSQVRAFITEFLLATGIGIFLQFFVPFVALPRPFEPDSIWGQLLLLERAYDAPSAAFPSFGD
jgi:hypothetical protein